MTRKEVCNATGLSIKTLRLYEEKGLIAPERQYRNGREYRVYTRYSRPFRYWRSGAIRPFSS